ncbi:MAG: 50S ribosomal protein L9 [Patescibacteria group bacterium]
MKVILLKNISNLGRAGEIKEIKTGYARNFLLAKGLADMVSKHSINVLHAQKKKLARLEIKEEKNKKNLAKKVNNQVFIIEAKADDKGNLYAKLSQKAIVDVLNKAGYQVLNKEIILKENIKKIGEYEVELKLAGEKAKIKLIVKAVK